MSSTNSNSNNNKRLNNNEINNKLIICTRQLCADISCSQDSAPRVRTAILLTVITNWDDQVSNFHSQFSTRCWRSPITTLRPRYANSSSSRASATSVWTAPTLTVSKSSESHMKSYLRMSIKMASKTFIQRHLNQRNHRTVLSHKFYWPTKVIKKSVKKSSSSATCSSRTRTTKLSNY